MKTLRPRKSLGHFLMNHVLQLTSLKKKGVTLLSSQELP